MTATGIREAARMLAAENQHPYTADGQAAADGHEAEYLRDVPRTCSCLYRWARAALRYEMFSLSPGCPWHRHVPEGRR
jgi:hypothetical protein